jgi:hypothetical protein
VSRETLFGGGRTERVEGAVVGGERKGRRLKKGREVVGRARGWRREGRRWTKTRDKEPGRELARLVV